MRFAIVIALAAVTAVASKANDWKITTGCFIGPTFIQGVPPDACFGSEDWPRVMQAPVVGVHGRPLVLLLRGWRSGPDDTRVATRVRQCSEYFATHIGGPINNVEQRANNEIFRRACNTGKAIMEFGSGPRALVRSYVARDGSDLVRLEDVPAAVLELAWLDDLRAGGPTLANPLKRGEVKVLDPRVGQLRVRWRDYVFLLVPTGRADVDGDGFEDLIVLVQSERVKGGARAMRFAFLTRKAPGATMTVVRPELKR